ncbi:MAG: hypothetical protein WA961_00740 [Rhodanobacter sp.]
MDTLRPDVVALGQSEQGGGKGQHKVIVLAFARVDRRDTDAGLIDPELLQLAAQHLSSGNTVDECRRSHFPIGLLATSQWPLRVANVQSAIDSATLALVKEHDSPRAVLRLCSRFF